MPRSKLIFFTLIAAFFLGVLPFSGEVAVNPAFSAQSKSYTASEKRRAEGQRENVSKKLSSLQADLQAKEARSEQTSKALQKSDQAISKANRRLRELKEDRKNLENELNRLKKSGNDIADNLKEAEETVSLIARSQYLNTRRSTWHNFINGTNPNDLARDNGKLLYLAKEQDKAIQRLSRKHNSILSVTEQRNKQRREISLVQQAEEKERQDLIKEKKERQIALGKLKAEIKSQQANIDKLKKDQRRLSNLISAIDKNLEEQRLSERKRASRPSTSKGQSSRRTKPYVAKNKSFAQLKGHLTPPVKGSIVGRFGQPRTKNGSTVWQGLQYKAKEGADVVACAPGKVVFSDWLRGFGNLIIVDHGNTYMSVYANNEALFKNVGDIVKQGETISSVGSSGGANEAGLYFELRYKGKPINPRSWLKR